ncbi:MAG TPA: heme-binding domain-containing protein [Saprospiraceae bacterium]|nr:heme-binding domain-containing protein [Saprospiraceae bacterium]
MIRKIFIALLAILVIIQFFRPKRNDSGIHDHAITDKYPMPAEVSTLFKNACYNCHSNTTAYPWYANVQPVAWWLADHIREAKQHLNFDDFTGRRIAFQNHKLEEIAENIEEKEMPLPSYTWLGLHPEAHLTQDQRQLMIDWAKAMMDTLKNQYPVDSLKMPKRPERKSD